MKEYAAMNANLGLAYDNDEDVVTGTAEVILMLTEPQYKITEDGLHSDRRNLEAVRFSTSWKGLQNLIAGLETLAEDLARLEDRVTIEPVVEDVDPGVHGLVGTSECGPSQTEEPGKLLGAG